MTAIRRRLASAPPPPPRHRRLLLTNHKLLATELSRNCTFEELLKTEDRIHSYLKSNTFPRVEKSLPGNENGNKIAVGGEQRALLLHFDRTFFHCTSFYGISFLLLILSLVVIGKEEPTTSSLG